MGFLAEYIEGVGDLASVGQLFGIVGEVLRASLLVYMRTVGFHLV